MTTFVRVDGPYTVTGGSGEDILDFTHTGDNGVDLVIQSGSIATGYNGYFDGTGSRDITFTDIEHFRFTDTGLGPDNIHAGDGDDTLNGGAGADFLDGGGGIDIVNGGTGLDLWGGDKSFASQAIVVDLTSGAAQPYLGTGSVSECEGFRLTTGSGDDHLIGTTENVVDVIDTGAGADRIELPLVANDTVHGRAGDDTLVVVHSFDGGVDLNISAGVDGYSGAYDGLGGNNMAFDGIDNFDFSDTGNGIDNIHTGDGRDTLSGGAGDDLLDSGRGSDTVDGGEGADTWTADKSFTAVAMKINLTKDGAQTYFAGGMVIDCEALRLASGSGNDKLTGTDAQLSDSIDTGLGDDLIVLPEAASDTVNGGGGTDTLVVTHAFGSGVAMNVSGSLAAGYSGTFDGLSGNNLAFTGIENIGFTDTGGGADDITTGDGRDTLSTGAGADTLSTGAGGDVVDGGEGVDLWTADKSATATAVKINLTKPGAQEYFGGGSVTGIEGMRLKTGSGDDKLTGTAADLADSIDAGDGDDQIQLPMNAGDVVNGGAGDDTLVVIHAFDSGVSMTVTGSLAAGYSGTFDGSGGNNLAFTGIENISFSDVGLGADDITTGDGRDTLDGGDGADQLRGGGGRDVLRGGAGADTLTGGGGKDNMSGGGGADRYVCAAVTDTAAGSQRDVIAELGNGDLIDLSAIDADTVANGDQAFTFIGSAGFHNVAGELRAVVGVGSTIVSGDVDGDGSADFQIELTGAPAVDGSDFVL